MATSLRGARAAVVLTVVASVFSAGPVTDLGERNETETIVDLPTLADPETAAGDELADSLRALDDAVVALAEEASAADAARAAAVDDLEAASAAHEAVAGDGDSGGAASPVVSPSAAGSESTTDMFRTLRVRGSATTSLGGTLVHAGGESGEADDTARAEEELEAAAAQVAAEAEAAEAALADAEAAAAEAIASAESRLVATLSEADDIAASDAADADAEAETIRAEAVAIADSLEEVEASRSAREVAALAGTTDADDPSAADGDDAAEGGAAPVAGTAESAAAPAPAPVPAPAPPPAPAPLPDPTGSVSGVLAAAWCADGRQIIVDGSIGGNVQLLVNDAHAAGVGICAKSGFRSHHEQVELRRAHCGDSDYAIFHAPPSTCSPPTARPGTSNHEGGLAVDFSCNDGQPMTHASPCYQWLAGNAARYGLYNLPSEPWHWSVTGR